MRLIVKMSTRNNTYNQWIPFRYDIFKKLIELDSLPAPISSRELDKIVESLEQDMTPEEVLSITHYLIDLWELGWELACILSEETRIEGAIGYQ